jgi:integrase
MASTYYLYRSTKENAPLTVRLLFRHSSKDFTISSNSNILIYSREELALNSKLSGKDYWSKIHNLTRIKDISLINKQHEVKANLNKLENYILKEFDKIQPESATNEWLKGVIEEYHNPKKVSEVPNTLIEFFDYYLTQNPHLKYGTSKKYITIKNKLIKRKHLFGNTPIFLSEINDNFRLKYLSIFSDYNSNTIFRDLSEIKTLCKLALKKGKEINLEVLDWKFNVIKTPFVYLDEKEIEKIKNLKKLSDTLDNVRDWLIISCYTGQRISDFMRFNKSMIRQEKNKNGKIVNLIEFKQEKTQKIMTVPLHPTVIEILDKRQGDFPKNLSDQKYNDYVKEICLIAKMTQKTNGQKITVLENGDKRTEIGIFEKWELISSHIGRRSFATNNFGVIPTSLLMSITGHSKEVTFHTYIGKTQTEQAKQLADYF